MRWPGKQVHMYMCCITWNLYIIDCTFTCTLYWRLLYVLPSMLGSNTCQFLINTATLINARGCGTILTISGKAKTKQRNYIDKANLPTIWPSLITATVCSLLASDCTDSFSPIVGVQIALLTRYVASNNTHFLVVPVVVLARHLRSASTLVNWEVLSLVYYN